MDTKPLEECRLKGFFLSSSVHQTSMLLALMEN